MPRVLILHERLSQRGGADRYLLSLLEGLRGAVEFRLVAGRDDQSLDPAERGLAGDWVRVKGLDRSGLEARGGLATTKRLAVAIRDFRPDVIHVHNLMDPAALETALSAAPTVLTLQDHRFFCPGRGKLKPDGRPCQEVMSEACLACFTDPDYGRRILALTRRRLELAGRMGRLTVLSGYMARELARAGVTPEKVRVVAPFVQGLDPQPRTGPGRYHLLAGRLARPKGIDLALAALERLASPLPLWIAGDGPMRDKIEAMSARSRGRLLLLPWAGRAELTGLLSGARSLWLPSLWAEPFGIAGLEALYCGVPVIATDVGGVGEYLIHEAGGLLVPPADPVALAQAADRLAGETDLAQALGRAGADLVRERFGPERFRSGFLEVYSQAAGAGFGPA